MFRPLRLEKRNSDLETFREIIVPSIAIQLDPEYLKNEARTVALDVAAEKDLFLAPEALPAVDSLVNEQLPVITENWAGPDRWKHHVRHVSAEVADTYVAEQVKRVVDKIDLLSRARRVLRVYPYD